VLPQQALLLLADLGASNVLLGLFAITWLGDFSPGQLLPLHPMLFSMDDHVTKL
jgi:hypothetical protein